MKRPDLQPNFTPKQFKEAVALHAAELDRWIELSVKAFSSDPKERAKRLELARDPESGFRYFVETYLPHYVKGEASLFHEAVFDRVPTIIGNEKGGARELFIAPRGSSKSTHLSLGFALYCIALGLKKYIIEVSDVYAQAVLLIEGIKSELTTNPRLAFDFPEACGQGRVWREGEIITKNAIRLEGLGALQKIRGRRHGPHRPDLIFFDDIENDEMVRSPAQRDKLENWLDSAALEVGPPDGSLDAIYVGTVIHFDAVIVRKSKSPAWHITKYQAIQKWPDRMDLWDKFEEFYHNEGPQEAKNFYQINKTAMDQGAVVNWPSIQPLVFLMLKRAASHAAFAKEYQNKPINENSPFSALVFWVQRVHDLIHFGAIDPSLGKYGRRNDPSAILIGGYDPLTGVMDILEASIRKRLPSLIISDSIALQREYGCFLWFVEAVQFQEFLATSLMADAAKAGVALPVIPVTPHADKNLRIERLQPPVSQGLIRINPAHTTLIDQLQQWPNADHDDGPDCMDMLWQNALMYSKGAGSTGGIQTAGASGSSDSLRGYRS